MDNANASRVELNGGRGGAHQMMDAITATLTTFTAPPTTEQRPPTDVGGGNAIDPYNDKLL